MEKGQPRSGTELPVISLVYDLVLWFGRKSGEYPKKFRFNIGEKVLETLLEVLGNLVEAQYSHERKKEILRRTNMRLQLLRYLMRLSKDLQCITLKEYEYAARQIHEVGAMVGGWEKYSQQKESDGAKV